MNNNWDTSISTALLPYPQYFSLTNNYPSFGNSTYHSLQVLARKNTAHGLTFIAAYTFSKSLTDTDSALYYPSYAVQDFYNRKLEKSIASFDHPQSLKLTWIYSLPIGRGQRWLSGGGPADRLFLGAILAQRRTIDRGACSLVVLRLRRALLRRGTHDVSR